MNENKSVIADYPTLMAAEDVGVFVCPAIQQPGLEIWKSKDIQTLAAQKAIYHLVMRNRAARRGECGAVMERTRA